MPARNCWYTLAVAAMLFPATLPGPAVANDRQEIEARRIEHLRSYSPNIEFPAAGALFANFDGAVTALCSGALIAPGWFMTSAHCIRQTSLNKLRVYLPTEGIIDVRRTYFYCEPPDERGQADCDDSIFDNENKHDLALIELAHRSTVWPAFMVGEIASMPSSVTRVGYGANDINQVIGVAIKSHINIEVDDCSDNDAAICQDGPGHPCRGDSGSPLLVDQTGEYEWIDTAVTRSGGEGCQFGTSEYIKLWYPSYKSWINEKTASIQSEIDQVLEIKSWGLVGQGYLDVDGADVPTGRPTMPNGFAAWEPLDYWHDAGFYVVQIPPERGISVLRLTLNHQEHMLAKHCPGCSTAQRQNRFELRVYPPDSDLAAPIVCAGPVYIHCDIENPHQGLWRIRIASKRGVGPYQFLALPLGPRAPSATRAHSLGPKLHSGPILRINTKENGEPSDAIMRKIEIDIDREIRTLERRLRSLPPTGDVREN